MKETSRRTGQKTESNCCGRLIEIDQPATVADSFEQLVQKTVQQSVQLALKKA
jgi:hypothetical protein